MAGIVLHVASAGNEAMQHIARLFAEGFDAVDVDAAVVVDGHLPTAPDGRCHMVIAPHEYFPLHFLRHRPTIDLAPALELSAVLTVEQPGSEWFEVAWRFARQARLVFDISPAAIHEYARRGIDALHTPLGWAPSLSPPDGAARSRDLDVVLFGHGSPRREAFVARHASFFSSTRCQVLLSDVGRPRRETTPGYVHGDARARLMASTRIVLSVHSNEREYFEQHRALLAIAAGSLLVSEKSQFTVPLEAGRHFLMGPLDELPALCGRLLDDSARLDSIAAAGQEFVRAHMRIDASCRRIAEAFGTSPGATTGETARAEARARLGRSRAIVEIGERPWSIATNAAASAGAEPRVSVVVTSFNYESYLAECLRSVFVSTPPPGGLELVVVDDGSTDRSVAVVSELMQTCAMPVTLIRKTLNTGLADARNVGIEHARGAHVFILDADNWILPDCLCALDGALGDGAAAAFGLIARQDQATGESSGLLSAFDWDVARLLEGPYIDAMALFDRQVLVTLGGYSTELIDHGWFGWEDYDLWLKIAQAGHSVRRVPRVVARYRDHHRSMIRRTNRDTTALALHLRSKFQDLVARFPDLDGYFAVLPGASGDSPDDRERAALHAQVRRLEMQLAEVYRSASWRVTAPLRALGAWRPPRGNA